MSASCPHCQSTTPGDGAFCVSCGKALPTPSTGPRIVGDKDFATSATGQVVQADEMKKKARSAFNILLTLAIIQFVLGIIFTLAGMFATGLGPDMVITGIVVAFVGLVFGGLAAWAWFAPLPAAITGLVVYCTLSLGDIALMLLSNPAMAFRGIFFKVLIIAALIRAVQAAIKHRELKRQLAAAGREI